MGKSVGCRSKELNDFGREHLMISHVLNASYQDSNLENGAMNRNFSIQPLHNSQSELVGLESIRITAPCLVDKNSRGICGVKKSKFYKVCKSLHIGSTTIE